MGWSSWFVSSSQELSPKEAQPSTLICPVSCSFPLSHSRSQPQLHHRGPNPSAVTGRPQHTFTSAKMIKVAGSALLMSFAHVSHLHLSPQAEKRQSEQRLSDREAGGWFRRGAPSPDETELKEEGVVEWNEWR